MTFEHHEADEFSQQQKFCRRPYHFQGSSRYSDANATMIAMTVIAPAMIAIMRLRLAVGAKGSIVIARFLPSRRLVRQFATPGERFRYH